MNEITAAQLEAILRRAGANIDKVTAPVLRATAAKVADTQRRTVPVRTGKTRDSIRATGPAGAPFGPTTNEAEIGPTWFVARFIEYGTPHRGPRVFVANSLEPHEVAHRKAILDAVAADAFKGLA